MKKNNIKEVDIIIETYDDRMLTFIDSSARINFLIDGAVNRTKIVKPDSAYRYRELLSKKHYVLEKHRAVYDGMIGVRKTQDVFRFRLNNFNGGANNVQA